MTDRVKTKNEQNAVEIIKLSFKNNVRQYTMFIALIGIMLIFSLLSDVFLTPRNLSTLFLQTSHIAVLSCGVVLVIVAGHIDLSIGAVVGLTGAIVAILQSHFGLGIIPSIFITIAIGALIGVWQGYWVAYRDVPAFIVTLSGMMVFNGLLLGVTKGETIATSSAFNRIGQDYIPTLFLENSAKDLVPHDTTVIILVLVAVGYLFMEFRKRKERKNYNFDVLPKSLFILKVVLILILISTIFFIMALYLGIPYSIIILMIIASLYTFLTTKTTFGRHVYAIGGNKEAAKLSGINIRKRTLWIFISSGVLGSIGGILYTARVGSAAASAGHGMELDVIASAIIGGTSTLGGEGTIIGAIIGALVMATLNNGMLLLDVGTTQRLIVRGLVLLVAVWVDIVSRKKNS
ncbi:sugar ABC transporter permease [Paramaledivibacter caminithermalis]|uniref:Xylose transport system permease protein XylH n=1 Tax=Paramaledivibacter caminithermalis (strain DSM 15212 / CIP 107654 / DViRD3) TaxID=1121301 RepID=A0A1M6RXA9_PARC5|nr:sugar ABC transporter permease [Paramaledivibacter caminithermalis]SHK36917.1 xylose ABC transporter membrane protein [Paramaledivibacter caminithermalis DSM 15212]